MQEDIESKRTDVKPRVGFVGTIIVCIASAHALQIQYNAVREASSSIL